MAQAQRWTAIARAAGVTVVFFLFFFTALLSRGGSFGVVAAAADDADGVVASGGNVTVKWVDHPLVMSSIGPDNPLPAFFFSRTQVR